MSLTVNIFFTILVSGIAITSKQIWVESRRNWRSSMILERDHAFMWRRDREYLSFNLLRDWISSILQYFQVLILSEFCFWSEEKSLNWLKILVKFTGGFNTKNESIEFWSLHNKNCLLLHLTVRDGFVINYISKRKYVSGVLQTKPTKPPAKLVTFKICLIDT